MCFVLTVDTQKHTCTHNCLTPPVQTFQWLNSFFNPWLSTLLYQWTWQNLMISSSVMFWGKPTEGWSPAYNTGKEENWWLSVVDHISWENSWQQMQVMQHTYSDIFLRPKSFSIKVSPALKISALCLSYDKDIDVHSIAWVLPMNQNNRNKPTICCCIHVTSMQHIQLVSDVMCGSIAVMQHYSWNTLTEWRNRKSPTACTHTVWTSHSSMC